MVISTVNQVVYNGDGINTAWPYTFKIIDATDIKLTIVDADGAETPITADYYVDTINNTVYYPGYAPGAEPPAEDQPPKLQEGQKIIVYRQLPVNQLANLGEKWPFYVIEKGLDKLTMIAQQIWDRFDRCLQLANGVWNANGITIDNLPQPDGLDQVATKRYVDNLVSGIESLGDDLVVCNTVADMVTLNNLVPGLTALTKGRYDINDGNGCIYTIRAKRAGDANTDKTVFLNNNSVAERIANIGVTNMFYVDSDGYVCQED